MEVADPRSGPIDEPIPESPEEPQTEGREPVRVLLVGDGAAIPKIHQQLTDASANGSYNVAGVETLAEGFGAIVSAEYDVYVVDHYVGVRTGFDLLARINEEGIKAPIVFVAGASDHGTGVTAVGAGAACYIVEDAIESDVLRRCLVQAMEQQTTLSQLDQAGVAVDGVPPTKAQILSHIAERLRNPAAEILDAARDSLMYALPAHTVESLASIEDQANGLLTLANDLVDLSMLEAGHLEFAAAEFSLRGLVSNVKRLLDPATTARPAEVVDEVADDVPDVLVGDPGRLRRIIARFVESVTERTSTDRVTLGIAVAERNTTTVTLRFAIDAVPTGDQPASDEALPSADDEPVAIGLPVVLETLSRMGGRVSVDGEERQSPGIKFTIRLQLVADPVVAEQQQVEGASSDRPVLIISDSITDRRSMVKTLGEAGMEHVVATSVDEWMETRAATIDNPEKPALALIDSSKDSFAEADRFTQRAPSLIPIVVISSSGRRGDAARCRHHGISGYLAKPIEPSDLVDVVRSTMKLADSGDRTTLVTRYWVRDGRPSLRVLVVDDSQTNRFLMTRMLEERGHSTTVAADGLEAVEMVERANFDVVLMDVMMPGMDGLEATRLICERRANPSDRPLIIGVSAFTDDTSQERGRAAGMATFLAKPIRPDDLYAAVEQQLPTATEVDTEPEAEIAAG